MKKIKVLSKFLGILSTFMLTCLPFSAMESEDNNKQPSENINKINISKDSLEKIDDSNKSKNKLNDLYEEKNKEENNVKALKKVDDNQSENINKINIDEESLEKIDDLNKSKNKLKGLYAKKIIEKHIHLKEQELKDINNEQIRIENLQNENIISDLEETVINLIENNVKNSMGNKIFKLTDVIKMINHTFETEKHFNPNLYIKYLRDIIEYFKRYRAIAIRKHGQETEIELFTNHLLKYLNDPVIWENSKKIIFQLKKTINELEIKIINLVKKNIDLEKYNLPKMIYLLNIEFKNLKEYFPKEYIKSLYNIIEYFKNNRTEFIIKYGKEVEIEFFKRSLLKKLNDSKTWNTLKKTLLLKKALLIKNQLIDLYYQFINPNSYKKNYRLFIPIEKQLEDNHFKNLKNTSPEKYVEKLENLKNYFLTERPKFINAFSICVEALFFRKPYLIYLDNPNIWIKLAKGVINDLTQEIFKIVKNDKSLKKYINSENIEQILKDNFDYEGKETQPRKYIESLIGFLKYLHVNRPILIKKYDENVEKRFFEKNKLKDINNEEIWKEFSKEIKPNFEKEKDNIVNINTNKKNFKLSSLNFPAKTNKLSFKKSSNLPNDDFSVNLLPKKDIKLKNRSLSLDNLKDKKNKQTKIDFNKIKFDDKIKTDKYKK